MSSPALRFDLGGLGRGGPRLTVNIHEDADIRQNFLDLDAFCEDGTAEEFYLSHALEHIPSQHYRKFLTDLRRKLRPGGTVRVIQSDIKRSLEMYHRGELPFRAVRTVIFPPADRLRQNPFHQHFNMWGAEELAEDFLAAGYASAEIFDAGTWRLDTTDELHPGAVEPCHRLRIPNLGVVATRGLADNPAPRTDAPVRDVAEKNTIPRIIHQTWKTRDLPPAFPPRWIDSWRELNPGWEYRFWTDEDIHTFVRDHYPGFYPAFCLYDVPIKRVDAFRYLLLRTVGGVYADLDFMCLKPLDELLHGQKLLLGNQHPGDWRKRPDSLCNAFMAGIPGHPFWNGITQDLLRHTHFGVLDATGPNFLTGRMKRGMAFLEEDMLPTIADHTFFYPFPWNDAFKAEARTLSREALAARYPDAFAVTFWTATWQDNPAPA